MELFEDILTVVEKFCSPNDFLQLCHVSKQFYEETKIIKKLSLNRIYSLKFWNNTKFREKVFSTVVKENQVNIRLKYSDI